MVLLAMASCLGACATGAGAGGDDGGGTGGSGAGGSGSDGLGVGDGVPAGLPEDEEPPPQAVITAAPAP